MSVAEVRTLLLLQTAPEDAWHSGLWWSRFRRRHQAVAQRCHRAWAAAQHEPLEEDGTPVVLESGAVELTEERWEQVATLLAALAPKVGRPPKDDRTVLLALLWLMRHGTRWEDLPTSFGSWSSVYSRYHGWRRSGLWDRILACLRPQPQPSDT